MHLSTKMNTHDHEFMLEKTIQDHKIWSHHITKSEDLLGDIPPYHLTHLKEAVKSFQIHTCGDRETSKCWVNFQHFICKSSFSFQIQPLHPTTR